MSPAQSPLDPSLALGTRQHPEDTAQSHLAAGVSTPTRARPGPRPDLSKETTCVLGSSPSQIQSAYTREPALWRRELWTGALAPLSAWGDVGKVDQRGRAGGGWGRREGTLC